MTDTKTEEFVRTFINTVRELVNADPEFVYERPEVGGDGLKTCVYALEVGLDDQRKLCPSCLFGQVADKMGFLDLAHVLERQSIYVVIERWARVNGVDTPFEPYGLLDSLGTAARASQYQQDEGQPWSVAGSEFEKSILASPILAPFA